MITSYLMKMKKGLALRRGNHLLLQNQMQSDMKAEELMIGDLVKFVDDESDFTCIVKVLGIDRMGNIECYMPGDETNYEEGIWAVSEDCFEPVPLTPEILAKCGFKQDKKCRFTFETDDEDVIIDLYDPDPRARLSKKEDYDKMVGVRLSTSPPYGFSYWGQALVIRANFVHEFQHALRLCGITKELVI